ncbi:hypothetical protein TRSC58_01109 [Trypanosoma rangeli SC58]|uniref:Uncharacterized protein n=1 Tax=Trypanosoma rangeli SC58 TaxID=429131 RepID=A0A061J9Y9_TRYRA|nr:hypothetical protein TRSC58_01109 [Trypanosoma rangeli SC58]
MDRDQSKACALMTRLQRRVMDEEERIVQSNKNLLDHLLDASDTRHRERRGMNNRPTEAELRKWYRVEEQAQVRRRDRAKQEAAKQKQNLIIMKHLMDAKPSVATAKQLAQWHQRDHTRYLREMSRFKRAESFAGANLLRSNCRMKLAERGAGYVESRTAALKPLLWREYKLPTLMDTLSSGKLLPSLEEASRNYAQGNLTLNTADDSPWAWIRPPRRREKKPEWKSITALDIKVMNYANDLALARGGDLPIVRREEENGVTRLWREGLERSYRAKERHARAANRQNTIAGVGDADDATSRRVSKNTIMWDADRWKSRSSIFTLLRSRSSKSSEQSPQRQANDKWGALFRRGGAREESPVRIPSAKIKRQGSDLSFSGLPQMETHLFPFAFAQVHKEDAASFEQAYVAPAGTDQDRTHDVSFEQAYVAPAGADQGRTHDVSFEQAYVA